jgi:hypothetical protein
MVFPFHPFPFSSAALFWILLIHACGISHLYSSKQTSIYFHTSK